MSSNHDQPERLAFRISDLPKVGGGSRRWWEDCIHRGLIRSYKVRGVRVILRRDVVRFLSASQPLTTRSKKRDDREPLGGLE